MPYSTQPVTGGGSIFARPGSSTASAGIQKFGGNTRGGSGSGPQVPGGATQIPVPGGPGAVPVPGGPNPGYGAYPPPGAPPPNIPAASSTAAPNPVLSDALGRIYGAIGATPGADPLLDEQVNNYRDRLSADTTQRSVDKANLTIGDAAAGASQVAKERAAAMGGGEEAAGARIDDAKLRAQAASTSGIQLGREAQLDALVLGGQGLMGAPGQREITLRGQNLSALGTAAGVAGNIAGNQQQQVQSQIDIYNAQVAAEQARQAAIQQQQQAMLGAFGTLWDSGGGAGSSAGSTNSRGR